jgi:ribosomal-protein-alanine N-acetyltransferase
MAALLEEQQSGTFLMYVLTDQSSHILGRVNLTASGQPFLGYRIAQPHAGKGLATMAVQQICVIAKTTLMLSALSAQAAQNNLASQRVLLSNDFARSENALQKTQLNGNPLWLEHFHKPL